MNLKQKLLRLPFWKDCSSYSIENQLGVGNNSDGRRPKLKTAGLMEERDNDSVSWQNGSSAYVEMLSS